MKRIMITAALSTACFLFASQSQAAKIFTIRNGEAIQTDTNKTKASVNRERSLAIYKGIETGDLSMMDKFVAADIVEHGGREEMKGLENVKKMLADIHNHFNNLKFTLITEATSADGMYHFALVRMTGTTKEAHMGMPANSPMDHMSIDLVRIQNNKIVEHWGFQDMKHMMQMMEGMKSEKGMKGEKMDKTKKQ